MDNWITMLIVGLVAGALGKFLMPGKDPGGCIITIILGIAGAYLGGFIAGLLGFAGITGGFDFRTIALSVVGVIILLLIYRMLFAKKK